MTFVKFKYLGQGPKIPYLSYYPLLLNQNEKFQSILISVEA